MKYYKKVNKKVEIVEKYIVTKIRCEHCNELITNENRYCEITEYPKYPEDSISTRYIHEKCLVADIKRNYSNYHERYADHIELEFFEFSPYEDDDIDYGDIEDKEE